MLNLHGRVAIVTTAGNGIGRASALAFAASGATVVVSDVDDDAGAETVRLIASANGTASYRHADVSDEDNVVALVTGTVEQYGRLDWAHNNAAAGAAAVAITEQKRSTRERVLGVTLTGPCCASSTNWRRCSAKDTAQSSGPPRCSPSRDHAVKFRVLVAIPARRHSSIRPRSARCQDL